MGYIHFPAVVCTSSPTMAEAYCLALTTLPPLRCCEDPLNNPCTLMSRLSRIQPRPARIVGAQAIEHHSAQPTFQAPYRCCARVTFGASALVVVPAGTIETQLDHGDAVDGGIDLPVA